MPTVNVPPLFRFALYALTAVGTPVVAYLVSRGILGDLEATLWSAEVTVVLALAMSKTDLPTKAQPPADDV